MVGDGSYMMANSELATAVMMGVPFTVVLTDNRGYGCINRLQKATGGAPFNNLLDDSYHVNPADIDFVAHAAQHGGEGGQGRRHHRAGGRACGRQDRRPPRGHRDRHRSHALAPKPAAHWWDVAVPEVSARPEVNAARTAYEASNQDPAACRLNAPRLT